MRRTVAILLALMMVLSLAGTVFAQPPERPDVPGPKQSLVALGDSITAGYGLERNLNWVSRKAYPQLLGDEIGCRVTNLAVAGMTSCEVLEAVQSNNRYRNAIARADIIILNVGGADMLGYLRGILATGAIDIEELQAGIELAGDNIAGILDEIRTDLNSHAPILLYGLYNPICDNSPYFDDDFTYGILNYAISLASGGSFADLDAIVEYVNSGIIVAAYTSGSLYVDAFTPFDQDDKSSLFIADGVHPSEEGQELLFEAAYDVLDEAERLDSRPLPPGLAKKAAMVP